MPAKFVPVKPGKYIQWLREQKRRSEPNYSGNRMTIRWSRTPKRDFKGAVPVERSWT